MYSFTRCDKFPVNSVTDDINQDLTVISNWLFVNRLALNALKIQFIVFHSYQQNMSDDEIPILILDDTVQNISYLRLTNRVIRYLPFSALVHYCVVIMSAMESEITSVSTVCSHSHRKMFPFDNVIMVPCHLQFGIACWGFERGKISKLQKHVMRVMTLSRCNEHI